MKKKLNENQQRLVCENLELAEQLAWKFGRSILGDRHEKCITMDDLKEEAVVGLTEAALRFDSSLGVEFGTFAFIWCRKFVLRAVRKYGTPLSVPDNFTEGVGIMHLDAEIDAIATAYADCDDNGSPADRQFYKVYVAAEAEDSAKEEVHKAIEQAMDGLNAKERKALACLFGLDNGLELSVKETATELGVVPGRVSQIKERALRKLERTLTPNPLPLIGRGSKLPIAC